MQMVKKVGNIGDIKTQGRSVYLTDGLSPTLIAGMNHGNTVPYIVEETKEKRTDTEMEKQEILVAMRGRPTDGNDYSGDTEQQLEPNYTGNVNTLTAVQKDNLILERTAVKKDVAIIDDFYQGRGERVFTEDAPTLRSERNGLKVAEVSRISTNGTEISGAIRASYYKNGERNVIENLKDHKGYEGVIETEKIKMGKSNNEICRIENGSPDDYTLVYEDGEYIYYIKIRKLTPRECWRLMGFSDADFDAAASVNSNTQLYKQAGNSIVKNVLVALIGKMFSGYEDKYKEVEK